MNKYLWCGISTSVLFLIWNLGHIAASKNSQPLKGTWIGTVYIAVGMLLILANIFFWIKGVRLYSLSNDEEESARDGILHQSDDRLKDNTKE